ncbi:MAG: hypothetical protein ACRD29_20485 [Acidimicrobiales bacterium]
MGWWDTVIHTVGNGQAVANARTLLDARRREEIQVDALTRRIERAERGTDATPGDERHEATVSPAA